MPEEMRSSGLRITPAKLWLGGGNTFPEQKNKCPVSVLPEVVPVRRILAPEGCNLFSLRLAQTFISLSATMSYNLALRLHLFSVWLLNEISPLSFQRCRNQEIANKIRLQPGSIFCRKSWNMSCAISWWRPKRP